MSTSWAEITSLLENSGLVKRRSDSRLELDVPVMEMAAGADPVDTGRWQTVFVEHVASTLGELIRIVSFASFVVASREHASGISLPMTAEEDTLTVMATISKARSLGIAYQSFDVWGEHSDKPDRPCIALTNSLPLSLLDLSRGDRFKGYIYLIANDSDKLERILADQYSQKNAVDAF